MANIDRRSMFLALAGMAASGLCPSVRAATTRPLRIVVPYPPGGPTDALARLVAEALRPAYTQGVIVENKPGGGGTIAARAVLGALPDGQTLMIGNNQTHVTAPHLIKDAGYDPLLDFQPICQIAQWPHVVVVRKSLGVSTIAALIERARAEPGHLTFGSTGPGSGSHLAAELFQLRTGTRLQHVPYQSAAQLAADIVAERLDLSIAISSSVLGATKSGQILSLAIAAERRLEALPDVPTLGEAGVSNANSVSWLAAFVHVRTPVHAVADLERQLLATFVGNEPLQKLGPNLGLVGVPVMAKDFRAYQQAEVQRWGDVIRTVGLKPE